MNAVTAAYSGGVLSITQTTSDSLCSLTLSMDSTGNPVVAAGDSNTLVNGVSSVNLGSCPGLAAVQITLLGNGHLLNVNGFNGGSASLGVATGSGAGNLYLGPGTHFSGPVKYMSSGNNGVLFNVLPGARIGA